MKLFRLTQVIPILVILVFPVSLYSSPAPQSAPNIGVNGSVSPNKVKRGRTAQATLVMNIPGGYHVNSNKPLEKFLIATQLKIEAPKGVRVGPIVYPRALLRSLKFSKSKVSVFEGRTQIRFNVTVPAGYSGNNVELKARLRYQSCNDEVCFPPQNRDESIWLNVE
ncbi:MAG TPA: protein-disulfide reductase DsbD N-terminal domain-containing protein [Pyrinomonadaceae bacterium]|nr:protein-disulfide reductase DsbD N-terminal domain-containing protein [Pyrinomonadaceae bacterium]